MLHNDYRDNISPSIDYRPVNDDPREAAHSMQPQRQHPIRNKLIFCLLALIIAAGIIEFTGGISFTSLQKELPTRTFTLAGHGSLIINDGSGTFHIQSGAGNQIIIQGKEYAYGLTNSLNNISIQYAQQGNTVTLSANEGWGLLGSSGVDFTITVPTNIDINLQGGSTDVDIARITGQVDVSTGSGNLSLNAIQGTLKVNTGSGNIRATDTDGELNAQTGSGNIHITQFSGPVNLSTASGDITLEQARLFGQDHLQTSSGNIHLNGSLDANGTYGMNTSSGDVTLVLPANSSFQLNASTNSGDVTNDFGSSSPGGTPRATLVVKTSSGNIDLQKQ